MKTNKIKIEYERQKNVPESIADYGIKKYTQDQKALHTDIMLLLHSKRYKNISADECMIVFARAYSTYVFAQLMKEKKIKLSEE